MELKTDSKIFNELLKIVDTYNEVYKDGISSYINLHNSQQIKSNNSNKLNKLNKSKTKTKNKYVDNFSSDEEYNYDRSDNESDDELNDQTNKDLTKLNKVDNNELEKKILDYEKEDMINIISNAILDLEYNLGLEMLSNIKNKIANYLIAQVLDNSPQEDIIITKFPNIKTVLYPYQINNLNWMLNIENKKYSEHYNDILNKIISIGFEFETPSIVTIKKENNIPSFKKIIYNINKNIINDYDF